MVEIIPATVQSILRNSTFIHHCPCHCIVYVIENVNYNKQNCKCNDTSCPFVGRSTIPRVPATITIKEISNILPVPTLSVMKPPPALPNREPSLHCCKCSCECYSCAKNTCCIWCEVVKRQCKYIVAECNKCDDPNCRKFQNLSDTFKEILSLASIFRSFTVKNARIPITIVDAE